MLQTSSWIIDVLLLIKTYSIARVGISAMRILRNAFATDASIPIREKLLSWGSLWWKTTWNWSANFSLSHTMSSPGQWPGKSLLETLSDRVRIYSSRRGGMGRVKPWTYSVTVSALTPTICRTVSLICLQMNKDVDIPSGDPVPPW